MKRCLALLLTVWLLCPLCACGKSGKADKPGSTAPAAATPTPNEPFEVKLTLENLYTYFDYHEFRADVKGENSTEVSSATVAYGLRLKPQFTAVNDPHYRDTMVLRFEAEGVVLSGDFEVDFTTEPPGFGGTTESSQRVRVSEQLHFWPKGDRTTTWAFGNYSSTNVMYFESFTVTQVSGSVWLKLAEEDAGPQYTPIPTPG